MESLIKKNLALLLGVLWICIALNFFLLPHSIASAGVGSIGYLIETGWSINRHIVVWGINLLMLALAFLLLSIRLSAVWHFPFFWRFYQRSCSCVFIPFP